MTNKAVARLLSDTAALIELTGGNAFRARTLSNASRQLQRLETPVQEALADGSLKAMRGFGKGIIAQIEEILVTQTLGLYDQLLGAIPAGLMDMLRVKGLGTKKVRQLWTQLGLTSLDELERAAKTGQIAELAGFGDKMQEKIIAGVQLLKRYRAQRRYAEAVALYEALAPRLLSLASVDTVHPTGSFRRKMDVVNALDVLLITQDKAQTAEALMNLLNPQPTDDGRHVADIDEGFQLRVALALPAEAGTQWFMTTGPEFHVHELQEIVATLPTEADETAIYAAAGWPVVLPELRDTPQATALLPPDGLHLITTADLQGTLHNHSTYSDGAHSLAEMADAARAMGYAYFGICDHSRSLTVANGLSIERVYAQQDEIARLNAAYATDGGPAFQIFSGIESDILADGSLDYPDDVLATFDFVVASIHSRFNMSEAEATDRLITAIENPYTTILGHPTGRLLLSREGYPIDHARIIEACAANCVAVELNANPYRLDLDWRWIRQATEAGCLISINPDAHSIEQLELIRWGVEVARKGWLVSSQCLNAKSAHAFAAWLAGRSSTPRA
ncbi:MAG: helix-hairpin-helix domain-containing protein [Rhodothermales bacterium]